MELSCMFYLCFTHLYPWAPSECVHFALLSLHAKRDLLSSCILWNSFDLIGSFSGTCRGFLDLWVDLGLCLAVVPWMVLVGCHSEGQLLEWHEVPRTALAVKTWTVMYSQSLTPFHAPSSLNRLNDRYMPLSMTSHVHRRLEVCIAWLNTHNIQQTVYVYCILVVLYIDIIYRDR